MFVAWPLYIFHAIMTGLSLAIANLLNVHLSFSFSAGAIDFALNTSAKAAHNTWILLVMGVVYAIIYYFVFRFAIIKFNLKTPGREDDSIESDLERTAAA